MKTLWSNGCVEKNKKQIYSPKTLLIKSGVGFTYTTEFFMKEEKSVLGQATSKSVYQHIQINVYI